MPARAMGSGTIAFGLVSIPVKLYSSSEGSSGIQFNWLHKKCHTRLKQQYVCPTDSEVVTRDDMEKGYEWSKGQFVTFTEQEIKDLQENPTQTIDITEFVPASKVDPIYFDRAYFLGPDKSDRAYKLLCEALTATGRVALAKYRARGKQYLVMLRPSGKGLVLQQLLYSHEVRSMDEVPLGDAELREAELQLAIQLVEQAATDRFDPKAYKDEVYDRVKGLIEQKVQGQDVSFAAPEAPQAQIIDLMEALKASLSKPAGAPAAVPAPVPAPAAAAAEEATGTDDRKPAKRAGASKPRAKAKG